ncbi:MAG: hypothetical protein CSB24_05425 [Deltaproteobacteria bacterium]|nr:MAG: hypothetical protein CSB24_05425 [Deltaproteobacteria bacterium]
MPVKPCFAAVVVSHNSWLVIDKCLDALLGQTIAINRIILVDSGSDRVDYLDKYQNNPAITLIKEANIGFARANNLGIAALAYQFDYLLLINPDLFVPADFTISLQKSIENIGDFGLLTGKLIGFDLSNNCETKKLDSTGVFRKWYGRWYDRGQGQPDTGQYDRIEEIPAACGAMICLPKKVVEKCGGMVFNPVFFMYKEDIELGIRLGKQGRKLYYDPSITAWHCRGWQPDRKNIPRKLKIIAAVSEIRLYLLHPSVYLLWAWAKYLLVRFFNW